MYVHRYSNFRRQKCDEERSREDSKLERRYSSNTVFVECKNKRDINNNSASWNRLRLIQEIPEQHIGKARNLETAENSHFAHCVHTSESNHVEVQNIQRGT